MMSVINSCPAFFDVVLVVAFNSYFNNPGLRMISSAGIFCRWNAFRRFFTVLKFKYFIWTLISKLLSCIGIDMTHH